MLNGIIITHGTMGDCLIRTLGKITGIDSPLIAVSNEGKDPDTVVADLEKADQVPENEPLFLFSEFVGGSTWFAANKYANMRRFTYVLTGVNLPMLISFVTKQDSLSPGELAERIKEDANRGITLKWYGDK